SNSGVATEGASMPRWVFRLGVGLLLVAAAFLLTGAVIGPPPGVTEANVKRIKPGLTLAEVEARLGGKATSEANRGAVRRAVAAYRAPRARAEGTPASARLRCWEGAEGRAITYFSADGKVKWIFLVPSPRPSPLDTFRNALGR